MLPEGIEDGIVLSHLLIAQRGVREEDHSDFLGEIGEHLGPHPGIGSAVVPDPGDVEFCRPEDSGVTSSLQAYIVRLV